MLSRCGAGGDPGFSGCSSWAPTHRLNSCARVLSCSASCRIFPDQGSNPCLLHRQADSLSLSRLGSSSLHLDVPLTELKWIKLAAAAKSLQSCPTLCDPIDGSPLGSPIPGILQARTRVGCHFLLQCMKVKSESEVARLCLTLSDPMDCSLPGSSVHGIFQARVLEWGAIAFLDILLC